MTPEVFYLLSVAWPGMVGQGSETVSKHGPYLPESYRLYDKYKIEK